MGVLAAASVAGENNSGSSLPNALLGGAEAFEIKSVFGRACYVVQRGGGGGGGGGPGPTGRPP